MCSQKRVNRTSLVMNIEPNEVNTSQERVNVESDAEKSGSPPPKKPHGDHAKPRRRKRAGRRKQKRENESPEEPAAAPLQSGTDAAADHGNSSSPWSPSSDAELDYDGYVLRPRNFPKAPENSTQFIIDDHNECRLYMSFETPNPYNNLSPLHNTSIKEPVGEDLAFIDIDYEYDPPQDFDNSAYNDREFEASYQNNRVEELLRLSRSELIDGIHRLEAQLKDINDCIVKENPSPTLEKLQVELVNLQEKNLELKASNKTLTSLMIQKGLALPSSVQNSECTDMNVEAVEEPALHSFKDKDPESFDCAPLSTEKVSVSEHRVEASTLSEKGREENCNISVQNVLISPLSKSEQSFHQHLLEESNNSIPKKDPSVLNDRSPIPEEHELGAVAV